MADYYYARIRTFKSTNNQTLDEEKMNDNRILGNTIYLSDGSYDSSGNVITRQHYVWYVVDVYKTSVSSFSTWSNLPYNQLGELLPRNLKGVNVTFPNKDTAYTGSDVEFYAQLGSIVNVDSHLEFTISNRIGGKPRSMTPIITPYWENPGNGDNEIIPPEHIWWVNKARKQQIIKFTGAAGAPEFPQKSVSTWLEKAAPEGPSVGTTVAAAKAYSKKYLSITNAGNWGPCTKRWYYMVVDSNEGTGTLWSSDENGITFRMELGKKDAFTPAPTLPKKQAWNQKNNNALKKAIDSKACKDPAEIPPSVNTDPDINVNVTPPTDAGRWNPPPHVESRSVPYTIRSPYDTNILDPEFTTLKGIKDLANLYSETGERFYSSKGYSYLERGRIFQDSLSAEVLNQTNTGGKKRGANESNQWGFRFMYNPQYISYETSANNSIDWTLGSKDTAALLAGNQTVTLQIYLNRIIDLGYLNTLYGRTNDNVIKRQLSEQAAYGRKLSPEEVIGIMNRGTEYDLEFLYRCLTGDPQTNNPLLNERLRKTGSADIGYITGIPLWLYLSDNMRYFGSVSRIGVNHIIFNTEMVPTLSIIDLSFARYPAQFANDAKSLESVRDNFFPPAST